MRAKVLFFVFEVTCIAFANVKFAYVGRYDAKLDCMYIQGDNIFEYLRDCFDHTKFEEIVNKNNSDIQFNLYYNPEGELKNIHTHKIPTKSGSHLHKILTSYFTDTEWETIFDYFHELPPLPLPNCITYLYRSPGEIYTKNVIIEWAYQSIIYNSGRHISCRMNPEEDTEKSDNVKPFDILEKKLYNYKSFYRTEHPDSLFGLIRWEEVKRRYHDALKSGEYKQFHIFRDLIYDCEFDDEGYNWEKIPIKNYSLNIQVPIDSKITIATDSLSAIVDFPDSTYVNIQYTKGDEWTKLYETETNPRKRQIYSSVVTEKYLLSSGEFELDGKMIYWQRIRYRYGVTVTLYTSAKDNLTKYYSTVIAPITVVLRPKFKTIYLNDDGY